MEIYLTRIIIFSLFLSFSNSIFSQISKIHYGEAVSANTTPSQKSKNEVSNPSPFNVVATMVDTGVVNITWQAPLSGIDGLLDPTQGSDFSSFLYNEPNENIQLGNLFIINKSGTVTAIEISTFYWEGAQSSELSLRFYNKDRVEIMEPIPFTIPDSAINWLRIEVPNFTYVDDFYVMIHWDNTPIQTTAVRFHEIEDNVAYLIENGKWMQISDLLPTYIGAISLRATIIETNDVKKYTPISYGIWRSNVTNIGDENKWSKLNIEPINNSGDQISFFDESYDNEPDGYYKSLASESFWEII